MRIMSWVVTAILAWPPPWAIAGEPHGELVTTGLTETSFQAVAVSRAAPQRIVTASQRAIYESTDDGRTWQERFRLPSQTNAAAIALQPVEPPGQSPGPPPPRPAGGDIPPTGSWELPQRAPGRRPGPDGGVEAPAILLATDRGLYGSFDGGKRWSRVFRGVGEQEANCRSVAFHPRRPEVAFVGTRDGLFTSTDSGRHWASAPAPPAAREIVDIAFDPQDPDRLYLVTPDQLWIGNARLGTWQRRFTTLAAEDREVEEGLEAGETAEAEVPLHLLSAIAIDPHNASSFYLATSRGLQLSRDRGLTWHRLPDTGLPAQAITGVLLQAHSPLVVYAATPHGVARFDPQHERWTAITAGWSAARVNDLAASPSRLWAATDQGLLRYELAPEVFSDTEPPSAKELLANFAYEPTITQAQQAAIRYAEVHPDKIKRWRRQAALKALLPTVDVGMDRDSSRDIAIDEGTFPKFQLIETEDRDEGLDISVTWDLGELIWNDDQTNIDVRSKLMVQLRDDILNEVTRTYFERRRVQVALLTAPSADQQTLLEQELRLQELTALLDGLTGGVFTQWSPAGKPAAPELPRPVRGDIPPTPPSRTTGWTTGLGRGPMAGWMDLNGNQ